MSPVIHGLTLAQQSFAAAGVPPRWRMLTGRQRSLLTNGCGGKGGLMRPPQFRFEASCSQHDFNYWIGGTEADRRQADRQFLGAMLEDARHLEGWDSKVHAGLARTYWAAVRLCGWRFFHYGEQRGWGDVWLVTMDKAYGQM